MTRPANSLTSVVNDLSLPRDGSDPVTNGRSLSATQPERKHPLDLGDLGGQGGEANGCRRLQEALPVERPEGSHGTQLPGPSNRVRGELKSGCDGRLLQLRGHGQRLADLLFGGGEGGVVSR